VPGLLRAQYVIDVEDIIAIFIVVAIILDPLAGLGQYATGISGRLVFEARIANPVRGGEVDCKSLERLFNGVR